MGLFGGSSDEEETDPRAAALVESARGDSVTADRLTKLKKGFGDENLGEEPVLTYLIDGEQPHYLLDNISNGVTVEKSEDEKQVEPSGAKKAFAAVTDRRVLFLVGGFDADEEVSLPYGAIRSVELESWKRNHYRLVIRGRRRSCTFPVNGNHTDESEIEAAREYAARQSDAAEVPVGDGAFSAAPAGTDKQIEQNMPQRSDSPIVSGRGVTTPVTEVYSDRVVLVGTDGSRTLTTDAITGVEFGGPGDSGVGYIYFDQQGYDRPEDAQVARQQSENAVTFDADCAESAREIRRAVDGLLGGATPTGTSSRGEASPRPTSNGAEDDEDEALRILRQRFARGELSVEEYETRLELLRETI